MTAPAPKIGYLSTKLMFPLLFERVTNYAAFTQFANIAGAPSMSLPLGQSSTGLPIGCMVSAIPGNEKAVLEVAYELEEVLPWRDRAPSIVAVS